MYIPDALVIYATLISADISTIFKLILNVLIFFNISDYQMLNSIYSHPY